ncbi:hypothetical protein [Chelativorans xinjiangense]|uniref:hypothetical protein n=1 Tax=Chelativorans xinjiangense TaxID=2681485 RepID=UPI00135A4F60|nr:hypothetical protein [Chelativorans xinjiangense]
MTDRTAAFSAFANDLAQIQDEFPGSQTEYLAMQSGTLDDLWNRLIERATDMKAKWDENPYVEVIGFSVSLGLSPAVDVQFNFKVPAE